MTAKHTPGPWYTLTAEPGKVHVSNTVGPRWAGNKHFVGTVTDANARLIAAAPELLAALEDLRAQLRAHVKLNVRKHYSLMVADAAAGTAIAKARGEG